MFQIIISYNRTFMETGKGIVWELVAVILNVLSMAPKKIGDQFSVLSRFEPGTITLILYNRNKIFFLR